MKIGDLMTAPAIHIEPEESVGVAEPCRGTILVRCRFAGRMELSAV